MAVHRERERRLQRACRPSGESAGAERLERGREFSRPDIRGYVGEVGVWGERYWPRVRDLDWGDEYDVARTLDCSLQQAVTIFDRFQPWVVELV